MPRSHAPRSRASSVLQPGLPRCAPNKRRLIDITSPLCAQHTKLTRPKLTHKAHTASSSKLDRHRSLASQSLDPSDANSRWLCASAAAAGSDTHCKSPATLLVAELSRVCGARRAPPPARSARLPANRYGSLDWPLYAGLMLRVSTESPGVSVCAAGWMCASGCMCVLGCVVVVG